MLAGATLAMFGGALAGCKPDVMTAGGSGEAPEPEAPGAATSYAVSVTASLLDPVSPVTQEQVRGWFGEAVAEDARFRLVDEGAEGPRSATVKVDYRANYKDVADGSGQIVGSVFIHAVLTLRPPNKRPEVFRAEAFVGEALSSAGDPKEGLAKLAKSVVREIGENLTAQVQMRHGTDAELLALLNKESPEILGLAIEASRERGLKQAAPRLKALLKHPERDVVNRAASALGDLGSRDVVPALIDAGSRVEPVDRLPVLYALGELGGPEAVLYLETLSESVTDPTVQRAARSALERARGPKK
ncbi:MAG: hypothetical protein CMH57_01935 [Myxococcales bacterium]|nr:hypothetical protein [Myxococcales bacterium]